MGNESFDDLLQAFQSALVTAQDSLRMRREEAVRRMCEADEIGGSRSSFFAFAIPQHGTDGDKYEVFPLPVSSFRAHHRHRIAMFSLEFECDLKEERFSGVSRPYSVVIATRNQRRWCRKKQRRMQIIFYGTDQPSGEVRIEGKLLVELPQDGGAGRGGMTPDVKRSIFSNLINLLRNLWQPQRFIMTVEQSQRVREIVEQADAETMMRGETAPWLQALFSK